jgi:CheY-like chemotaxis protein
MMDGSLTLDSLVGEGSTFKALIQSELIQAKQYDEDIKLINFEELSIAIFIEHDQIRRVLRNQLHSWKAKSFLIQSMDHFYEQIKHSKLDFAIMDYELFNQELEQQFKEHNIRAIYVIDMLGITDDSFNGCTLTKPILPSTLTEIIINPEVSINKQKQHIAKVDSSQPSLTQENFIPTESDTNNQTKEGQQRVFVVDDNEINLIVGKGILNDLPLIIDSANNGEDILEKLKALPTLDYLPIVLMDCQMPIMDGYTATRLIREGKAGDWLKNAPIIAMTADAMTENRAECKEAGMDDFIGKPFDPKKLKDLVLKWSQKKP